MFSSALLVCLLKTGETITKASAPVNL
jgi:hypothetical protein